ncbi:MAG TPA: cation:proton antiporter [Thermoanaerobaculia bacterium]|nr:cation:proton antiporter [Thermoanaerobaculia bacterium]
MNPIGWYLGVGALLVALAIGSAAIKRLPLTTAILYLLLGYAIGPKGAEWIALNPIEDSGLLERVAEIAVIVSLFGAGLKLRAPIRSPLWRAPLRLAFLSMSLTVLMIACVGVEILGLSIGAAVLLGAIISPTDPVLASDVQVAHPRDRDRLRFSLTGEAGLNDGTAFPFVMLGLGLLGLHDLGNFGIRWLLLDGVWAIGGGLMIGGALGYLVAAFIKRISRLSTRLVILDDYLAVGLIALAYGSALLCRTYGFLAVFAAGLALHHADSLDWAPGAPGSREGHEPEKPATKTILMFNEQLERIGEVVVVTLVGGLLSVGYLPAGLIWFAPLLFFLIRPAAVFLGLLGTGTPLSHQLLKAWFGIRGIGSVYYLMYAISSGISEDDAGKIAALTLSVVAISIVIHGITVTPLMLRYEKHREARE